MESSGKATRSALEERASSILSIILAVLLSKSPTVVLICASAIRIVFINDNSRGCYAVGASGAPVYYSKLLYISGI